MIVRTGLNLVALFARLSAPFIPFTAERIAATVGEVGVGGWPDEAALFALLPTGRQVSAPEVLFKKIEDEQLTEWAERFGGAE